MLAAGYRSRHPDLDVDTVHGMFALHKDELSIAELMRPYDMIVVDEVGQNCQCGYLTAFFASGTLLTGDLPSSSLGISVS